MAKFTITAENQKIKYELTFRDKVYDFTMFKKLKCITSNKTVFSHQLADDGIDLSALKCNIDDMYLPSYEKELKILQILAELEEIE